MPFLSLFLIICSVIYANDIKIHNTFGNLNKICIYNSTNSELKIFLKDKSSLWAPVTASLGDYSGIIEKKSRTGKVTIYPANLRPKVIYYKLYLSGPRGDDYYLHISGDDPGIIASPCPSSALAKIANTNPGNIANAALIAGVLLGAIFFSGVVWALSPHFQEKEELWD